MSGVYNPYAARRLGSVPGPSWKPRVRRYRVSFLFNGQEKFLGIWAGMDKHQAMERCREELTAAKHFNLIATEDKTV